MSGREEVSLALWVDTKVSPVRVYRKPSMTPTCPKDKESTSWAWDAYRSCILETRSRCWRVTLRTTLCFVSVPEEPSKFRLDDGNTTLT